MRYARRYTNDLFVLEYGDDWADMRHGSDYKVHIVDLKTGAIVWQNSKSERYGDAGTS